MFSLFLSSSTRVMNVTVMVNHQQKVKKETEMPRLFLKNFAHSFRSFYISEVVVVDKQFTAHYAEFQRGIFKNVTRFFCQLANLSKQTDHYQTSQQHFTMK